MQAYQLENMPEMHSTSRPFSHSQPYKRITRERPYLVILSLTYGHQFEPLSIDDVLHDVLDPCTLPFCRWFRPPLPSPLRPRRFRMTARYSASSSRSWSTTNGESLANPTPARTRAIRNTCFSHCSCSDELPPAFHVSKQVIWCVFLSCLILLPHLSYVLFDPPSLISLPL